MGMVKLKIAKQKFINNADLILPLLKGKDDRFVRLDIENWLNEEYELKDEIHSNQKIDTMGFSAADLNNKLREKMIEIPGIHKETTVDHGAFLKFGKEGFDFSIFDEEYNILKLRNSFVGNPGYYNGEEKLYKLNPKVITTDNCGLKKKEWKEKIQMLGGTFGENLIGVKKHMSIVGEIQFGNWAIASHDFFRLMNATLDTDIDFYIYITATGTLAKKLSKGIVDYSWVLDFLSKNKQLIKIPTWIIGLDLDIE